DVGGGPVEADRRQHAVEQPAGAADEGQTLQVLVAARRLADEHDVGLRVAVCKDEILGRIFQIAAVEIDEQLLQFRKRTRAARQIASPRRLRFVGYRRGHWWSSLGGSGRQPLRGRGGGWPVCNGCDGRSLRARRHALFETVERLVVQRLVHS